MVLHIENFEVKPLQDVHTLTSLDTEEIYKFLETHIQNISADSIRVIEWRPSLNYFKDAYVKTLSAVAAFLKRADAEKRTTAVFGKRWIKNFFKNIGNINHTLLYRQMEIPVIVTGSGPSLEQALPVIQKAQGNCIIIAASSSVLALSSAGITADLVIATDGGSWALKHIYPFYRDKKYSNTSAFAVNLCAALPSQCANNAQLILNDGSFWQNIVLHELNLPSVIIPQRGTVTATAVELALVLSSGNIYLAGLDFSVSDIRTHAKPYGFDNLFYSRANRFVPFYSESYSRSRLLHEGGSMNIYASWFKEQLNKWSKRIYSIGGNKIFEHGEPSTHSSIKKTDDFFKAVKVENSNVFCRNGIQALLNALKNPEYSQNIKRELNSLLFSGENEVTEQELETVLKETCIKALT
ncbi:6-hydroxymethylpterin diphosphokinase MptE-like protein [Treponema sp. R6D11]